jgi:SAM-dependent methyltransferase
MAITDADQTFAGSLPTIYETFLVPLIFEPYAADLAGRLASRSVSRVLEIAAGTGVVTRKLAAALPERASIVATDKNQPMIDIASSVGTHRPVEWRQADAMQLPFVDATFDAVVCQFGVMFFPDKGQAFAEMRRVLKPGGLCLFNVWDAMAQNEFADVVTTAVGSLYPEDPPRFLARVPYGYCDPAAITRDLERGGFRAPAITTVAARSGATSARVPAVGFCCGTPLRDEIEKRGPTQLNKAAGVAEAALASRFGTGAVNGRMQAHVVSVERNV